MKEHWRGWRCSEAGAGFRLTFGPQEDHVEESLTSSKFLLGILSLVFVQEKIKVRTLANSDTQLCWVFKVPCSCPSIDSDVFSCLADDWSGLNLTSHLPAARPSIPLCFSLPRLHTPGFANSSSLSSQLVPSVLRQHSFDRAYGNIPPARVLGPASKPLELFISLFAYGEGLVSASNRHGHVRSLPGDPR